MIDYNGLKKPEDYGDGKGVAVERALTPDEVHGNFLWTAQQLIEESTKPPIGIPTFWFRSLPSWARWADDGTYGTWEDFPEFNNPDFKDFLTIFSDKGWMPSFDENGFYFPDLQGMFPRLAGTSGVRGTQYAGGDIAVFTQDKVLDHYHYHRHGLTVQIHHRSFDGADGTPRPYGNGGSNITLYTGYDSTNNNNNAMENRPASFSLRLIVRFE
jgi:hypothetical protein